MKSGESFSEEEEAATAQDSWIFDKIRLSFFSKQLLSAADALGIFHV